MGVKRSYTICPNCGAALSPQWYECRNCGCRLPDDTLYGDKPPVGPQATPYGRFTNLFSPEEEKSRMVAGLFGILLGAFGVHSFYLGFTLKGVLQILLTLFSVGVFGIWGIIEGILILAGHMNTDAAGRPLRQ